MDELPAYEAVHAEVDARTYNLVRLGLRRLGSPLQLELPGLRGLALRLEHDRWTLLDQRLNDLPVLIWSDFETAGRGLHEPVKHRLRSYHAHGRSLEETVLEFARSLLSERMAGP